MLTTEPRMGSIFWARRPVFFKHISFRCPFLEPYLITYHSNIGNQIIVVFNLGTSTLHLKAWEHPKFKFNRPWPKVIKQWKPLRIVMLPMWCRALPHTPVVKGTHLHTISSVSSIHWLLPVAISLMTTVASMIIIFTYIWRTLGNSIAIPKWFFLRSIGDISPTQIYELRTPSLMSGRDTCITNPNIHISSTRMSHCINHIKLQHGIDAFQTYTKKRLVYKFQIAILVFCFDIL